MKLLAIQEIIIILPVYTTRPDTIYGVTFLVIAPDHDLVSKITNFSSVKEVEAYQEQFNRMTGTASPCKYGRKNRGFYRNIC